MNDDVMGQGGIDSMAFAGFIVIKLQVVAVSIIKGVLGFTGVGDDDQLVSGKRPVYFPSQHVRALKKFHRLQYRREGTDQQKIPRFKRLRRRLRPQIAVTDFVTGHRLAYSPGDILLRWRRFAGLLVKIHHGNGVRGRSVKKISIIHRGIELQRRGKLDHGTIGGDRLRPQILPVPDQVRQVNPWPAF